MKQNQPKITKKRSSDLKSGHICSCSSYTTKIRRGFITKCVRHDIWLIINIRNFMISDNNLRTNFYQSKIILWPPNVRFYTPFLDLLHFFAYIFVIYDIHWLIDGLYCNNTEAKYLCVKCNKKERCFMQDLLLRVCMTSTDHS